MGAMGELGVINRLVLNSLSIELFPTCSFNMFIANFRCLVLFTHWNTMVNNNQNSSRFHSSYCLIRALDIKSHNHIPKCIIPNNKSYEGMVFGSNRTNAEIRLGLGQGKLALGHDT